MPSRSSMSPRSPYTTPHRLGAGVTWHRSRATPFPRGNSNWLDIGISGLLVVDNSIPCCRRLAHKPPAADRIYFQPFEGEQLDILWLGRNTVEALCLCFLGLVEVFSYCCRYFTSDVQWNPALQMKVFARGIGAAPDRQREEFPAMAVTVQSRKEVPRASGNST